MKQTLQLRLGQQLTMTPQLQQAIRLLQLPTLELRAEIQEALDSNLMLETEDEHEAATTEEALRDAGTGDSAGQADGEPAAETTNTEDTRLGDDLPLDGSWDDIYDGTTAWSRGSGEVDDYDPVSRLAAASESLREHLIWQIQLGEFTPRAFAIAEAIIDAVSDDGYLNTDEADILAALPGDWAVGHEEFLEVLGEVQRLDPVGVAARDPRECLALQLEQLPEDTPWLAQARLLLDEHLDLLVNRQLAQIKRRMQLDDEALGGIIELIRGLDPHPGLRYGSNNTEYVIPDVFVRREDGRWQVEINPDAFPRVRINADYAAMVRRADRSRENSLMREHLQEARWLIKSLRSRNDTLLRVAHFIVDHQHDFLERGEEFMQPLVLREVAEAVEMHESTISRITNRKYMHTPRGTFEFKYFFSSHVQTADGGECSATAIRARIRRLIAGEDPRRPLSDSRIATILQDEGIHVARRTVAKYREAMAIASSTDRKRLA
ncbi:RNA polymerase factor sigma-54 [Arhodomonas sp. KWT]|uniref:RNA polymerase factor sigma-54 n=1 Tax=Arhodomonas sp. KWT TaxID=2679915 RepID=UPI0013D45BC4|nr:RNA polymerase factor sigma-54 [Arhodomonas sp. KWT]